MDNINNGVWNCWVNWVMVDDANIVLKVTCVIYSIVSATKPTYNSISTG